MIRHKGLRNLTICLLLTCMVTFMVAMPVQRVSALADIVPEVAPVFDTQIYQFTDYVDSNLNDGQLSVLYLMLGFWLYAQAGLADYTLDDPFANQDGVISWLKSCGIELYNSLITWGIGYDAQYGIDLRPYLKPLLEDALGIAQKAHSYQSEADFINDVNSSDHWYLPLRKDSMFALNSLFALEGGISQWQLTNVFYDPTLFVTGFDWKTAQLSAPDTITYNNYVQNFSSPCKVNRNPNPQSTWFNVQCDAAALSSYHYLFADTTNNAVYFCNRLGEQAPNTLSISFLGNNKQVYYTPNYGVYFISLFSSITFPVLTLSDYSDVADLFSYINTHQNLMVRATGSPSNYYLNLADILTDLYIGSDWDHKEQWHSDIDLGFVSQGSPSILLPSHDTYLDLKSLLAAMVNDVDLMSVTLDNLFNINGDTIDLYDLIKVSVSAALQTLYDNVPMPVDLNDLAEVTDNNYIQKVKEDAQAASSIIGEYVAFWHNVDYELVYVVFGCALFTLICAFIGKMGK